MKGVRAAFLASILVTGPLIGPAARAAELGGHAPPEPVVQAAGPASERKAVLEEMWQRRVLEPEQRSWSPLDLALLERIRRAEPEAMVYLRSKPGGLRPWVSTRRVGGMPFSRLHKAGYERYLGMLSQDALLYFENKGADAKFAFKLTDWDGRRLFAADGRITEEGLQVYQRARLKLEVFWRGPDGAVYGTRRPPKAP